MASSSLRKTVFFRDLYDNHEIKLETPGTFFFGLTTDGKLCAETDEENLCVKLFQVTLQFDGGCLLAPVNRDLNCVINSTEDLTREINLINGTTLEIAEKRIVYVDGSIVQKKRSGKRRRELPRTPGQSREPIPPPKPARSTAPNGLKLPSPTEPGKSSMQVDTAYDKHADDSDEESDEKKWLAKSFIMLDLPSDQQDQLNDLKTPEQISVLAASYFTKQLRMFTDAIVTGELIDNIFKLFMETVGDCHDSYMTYLSSVSNILGKAPDKVHLPMHRPAVRLATDLLKSCFDPTSRVILILGFIRTFSHFDNNLHTMIRYQTTTAVIGSMTAFNNIAEVQQHGLDILSKIAVYSPKLGEKPPLKEVGIEQVVRAITQHPNNVDIGRAACRMFANLSSTLITLLNEWIDTDIIDGYEKLESFIKIEKLQDFVFGQGIPVAQKVVDSFAHDLGVKMEFRRFVYFYAKYQHFKEKQKRWLPQWNLESLPDHDTLVTPPVSESSFTTSTSATSISSETDTCQNDDITPDLDNGSDHKETHDQSNDLPPPGILKKTRSYECLRTSQRRLSFDALTIGGSDSDSTSSDSDSDSNGFELHPPFEPDVPLEVDMEDDFSFDLVQHLVRKTRKKSVKKHGQYFDTSSSGTDESDREFLESLNYSAKCKVPKAYASQHFTGETCSNNTSNAKENVNVTENQNEDLIDNQDDDLETGKSAPFKVKYQRLKGNVDGENDILDSNLSNEVEVCNQDNTWEQRQVLRNGKSVIEDGPKIRADNDNSNSYSEQDIDTAINNESQNTDSVEPSFEEVGENAGLPESEEKLVEVPNESYHGSPELNERKIMEDQVETEITEKPENVALDHADVLFLGKLVQTQITAHVIAMVFQSEDSQVLQIIDRTIKELLQESDANPELLRFAENQYGENMTLMDLEPNLVINVIDAVRYRSVAVNLLHSALLSLTVAITNTLQPSTVNTTMMFFKTLFSNPHLQVPLTDEGFLTEFRVCFQNATAALGNPCSVEDIQKNIATSNFAI